MKFSANMFCSDYISQHKKEKYLKKIQKRKNIRNIILLIYRANNCNLLEVISTRELYRIDKREDDVFVFGIVQTMDEAYEWISKIAINTYAHYEDINKDTLFKELAGDA